MTRPPNTRLHRMVGVGSLASLPLDGGGIQAVQSFAAIVEGSEASIRTFRPTLAGGARPAQPSLVLAATPRFEPLELGASPVAFESDGTTVRAQVTLPAGTSLYGGGMVAGPLLRNGRAVELWNTDAWRYGDQTPALYQSHPYLLAVRADGTALGILGDSPARGALLVAEDGVELAFDGPFDVHLIEGADPRAVQRGLAALIGRMPLPPRWTLGYHQCRWSYESAAELRELAREFAERGIPCDALWLDIDHMHRLRSFTWDPERFPDPAGLIGELESRGLRAVAILDPGLAVDPDYEPYAGGLAGDHFVHDAAGRPARGRVWPGVCCFPDFTREATREWWASLVERYVGESGVHGLWNDMNEPAIFRSPTRSLPEDAVHRGLGGGAHARFHNLYGQLMVQATREGLERARPGRRPFVLTRANHLAGARFAATWTGDNQAAWDDLRWSIPMVLSLGLCGQPFSGPDLGGFDGDPTAELFVRWFELGAYLPFARGHSGKSACRKEPWSFGPEAEGHVRAALERRMRLLPALYTLFEEAARTGMPIARPLFFADPADPELRTVDDAFLLGDDLLVAPVVHEGAFEREVLLPNGGWYRWTAGNEAGSEAVESRRVTVTAPLGSTPLFARAGSILVTCEGGTSTDLAAATPRTLHVFPDAEGRASGRLYEDAGDGPEHGTGAFLELDLGARVVDGSLRVSARKQGDLPLSTRGWKLARPGGRTVPLELDLAVD